eukprot:CAMPEP_0197002198 /NCGR_PEP_ID=MMETSP1380-20130617/6733_1 /TAXON_ID=5936 /ORGANISM="Euplotes crassus, Strain CT5" /LENGTH=171 /DNA_ID=CAMNT_0042420209 /DNA_START=278 /DNA_END=793 /DNA_ORIENTATION=-
MSISGFFAQYKCSNPCSSLNDLIRFEYWAGTYQYTGSTGAIDGSTGPSAAIITKTAPDSTDTSSASIQKAVHNIATGVNGLTLSNTYNLPATNTTTYMKCFLDGNSDTNKRTSNDIPSTYGHSANEVELTSGNVTSVSGNSGNNSNNGTSLAYRMTILPALLIWILLQIGV